jgi:hypothetical protein
MNTDWTEFANDPIDSRAQRRSQQTPPSPSRRSGRSQSGRRQKSPTQVNGIHRRRRKRVRW